MHAPSMHVKRSAAAARVVQHLSGPGAHSKLSVGRNTVHYRSLRALASVDAQIVVAEYAAI